MGSFESRRRPMASMPSKGAGSTTTRLRWSDDSEAHGETQKWTLAFDGNKVDVTFESTDGAKVNLHGETDE